MNKKNLTERDICTKYITPALVRADWDVLSQIREEVFFTKGRIIVRGKLVTRGKAKFADYILYYKPNIPIALIEAKDNHHPVGGGMQQGLEYAATLDIPFVFSSNGDAFLFHDRTGLSGQKETELALDAFPTPEQLWAKYRAWKCLAPAEERILYGWGESVVETLALDLRKAFPGTTGYSVSSLWRMRQFYATHSSKEFLAQAVRGLVLSIPWGHHVSCSIKSRTRARAYTTCVLPVR